jgi:hypothetical protein
LPHILSFKSAAPIKEADPKAIDRAVKAAQAPLIKQLLMFEDAIKNFVRTGQLMEALHKLGDLAKIKITPMIVARKSSPTFCCDSHRLCHRG